MRRMLSAALAGLRWVGHQVGRLVADSPASSQPPGSNYMRNSSGEGGKVISSGHPGGN